MLYSSKDHQCIKTLTKHHKLLYTRCASFTQTHITNEVLFELAVDQSCNTLPYVKPLMYGRPPPLRFVFSQKELLAAGNSFQINTVSGAAQGLVQTKNKTFFVMPTSTSSFLIHIHPKLCILWADKGSGSLI